MKKPLFTFCEDDQSNAPYMALFDISVKCAIKFFEKKLFDSGCKVRLSWLRIGKGFLEKRRSPNVEVKYLGTQIALERSSTNG